MGNTERTGWRAYALGAACLAGAMAAVLLVAVYGVETMVWDAAHATWAYVERPAAKLVGVLGAALAVVLAALGVVVIVRALRRRAAPIG